MPSDTFFHLPEEKRARFLAAARAEFARASYAEASINQIIRKAGIPRGSFYMYFQDKEELFRYLLCDYTQQMTVQLCRLLDEAEGDLFEAFLRFFDLALKHLRTPDGDASLRNLMDILRRNAGIQVTAVVDPEHLGEQLLGLLRPHVRKERLSLEREGDLDDMLGLLLGVTIPALGSALSQADQEAVRVRYQNMLRLLKRGMEKPGACME